MQPSLSTGATTTAAPPRATGTIPGAISGTHGKGVVSHALTGLTTGTTYYYTAKAVTSAGTAWGPVNTFVPANTALNKYSIPGLALWLDANDLNGDGTDDSVTSGTAVSPGRTSPMVVEPPPSQPPTIQPTRQASSLRVKASVRFDGNGDVLNVSTIRAESGGYSVYATRTPPQPDGRHQRAPGERIGMECHPQRLGRLLPAIVVKKSGSANTLSNIKLGKNASSTTNDFGGDLGELLPIFTRELNATEEQKVEGYLAHRWGAPIAWMRAILQECRPDLQQQASDRRHEPAWYPIWGSVFSGPNQNIADTTKLTVRPMPIPAPGCLPAARGILAHTGDNHNTQISMADADVQNWNQFPTFTGGSNNFMTVISGSLTVPVSGTYNFRWSNDDAGAMYIDVNLDGVFSANESLAPWAWNGNGNISLGKGVKYAFVFMQAEGGGNDPSTGGSPSREAPRSG